MTGKELIDQICILGARTTEEFEQDFQTEHIYSAINNAIGEMNKLFPVEKTVQVLHYPRRPAVYIKGITVHKGGVDTVFDASDIKSLAFAVSGTGKATLTGQGASNFHEITWKDAANFEPHSVILEQVLDNYIGGAVRLIFSGNMSYMISDVSFYSELEEEMPEDIEPYTVWKGYDMASSRYVGGNFLGFSALPVRFKNVDLNTINDYYIEGTNVYLRRTQPGVYDVKYYHAPKKVDEQNLESNLDVDFRLHELIALRAAYYIYAVLDPEAASVCDREYQKLLGLVMTTMPKVKTPRKFRDLRGW